MIINGYQATIAGKTFTPEGYVYMAHGETYRIALRNTNRVRCSATVTIDGKDQGTFILEPMISYTPLERGVAERGLFTFFKLGTSEAQQAGLPNVSASETGLVQVLFKPALQYARPLRMTSMDSLSDVYRSPGSPSIRSRPDGGTDVYRSCGPTLGGGVMRGVSAGGTGLTGNSNQSFSTTAFTPDPDTGRHVLISYRLVCAEPGTRPLAGNKVPPPL